MMQTRRGTTPLILWVAILMLLAACGSTDDTTTTTQAAEQATTTTEPQGPLEGQVVWYVDVLKGNYILDAIAQGLAFEVDQAGGTIVRSFATTATGEVDVATMAQAIDRAVAARPAAIIYFLIDPAAFQPQFDQAREAGIPVIAVFGEPEVAVDAWIDVPSAEQGFAMGEALCGGLVEGDEVTVIAPPLPIPTGELAIDQAMEAFDECGLSFVGDRDQQRNPTDLAGGGRDVMQSILQRFPNLKGLYAYNDDTALGAISAITAAGREGEILIVSRNATPEAIAAIQSGELYASCDIGGLEMGLLAGLAVVRLVTGEADYSDNEHIPWESDAGGENCILDQSSVADYVPPDERVPLVDIQEG